jgi:hypothetical protein
MSQVCQVSQGVQVRQLGHIVRREYQRRQIGDVGSYRRLNMLHPIARKKEGAETRKEGEIPEGGDIVIRKVDCILVLLPVSFSSTSKGTESDRNIPLQHPGFQLWESCALHNSNESISIQLISKV